MIEKITHLKSIEHPELEPYRTLKRENEHRESGVFIAEGHIVVERLLKTSLKLKSILLTEYWFELFHDNLSNRFEPIQVFIGEKEMLSSITGFHLHQCIMALAYVPSMPDLKQIIAEKSTPLCLVALDGLTSADNVGLVVRNCAAFGVDAVIVGETSADPWLRRAVRKSMGNIFKTKVCYTNSLAETLRELRCNYDISCFAAQVLPESRNCYETDFTNSCCLVVGNEGSGVSSEIIAACGTSIMIPMANDVDSFNVSSAAAILLSEIVRQRLFKRKGLPAV